MGRNASTGTASCRKPGAMCSSGAAAEAASLIGASVSADLPGGPRELPWTLDPGHPPKQSDYLDLPSVPWTC